MRSLSVGLTLEQKDAGIKPSVKSELAGTILGPDRIVKLRVVERPFGSVAYMVIRNNDLLFNDDFKSEPLGIEFGCTYGAGPPTTEYSPLQPFWVTYSNHISEDGELLVELIAIDTFNRIALQQVIGGGGTKLAGTITGTLKPGDRITGATSGATGVIYGAGTGYIAVGRVAGAFSTETVVTDYSASNYIAVTEVSEFGGGSAPVWNGDTTILAIIQSLCSGICTVTLDSSDGIVDVVMPYYEAVAGTALTDVIKELLQRTTCGYRFESDGALHLFDATTPPSPEDYLYELDGDHQFDSNTREAAETLPNRIIVVNAEYGVDALTNFSGEANDTASQTRWSDGGTTTGIVTELIWTQAKTNEECQSYADSRLAQIQREASKGEFSCPIMNFGQELFDYVKVINPIDGITSYGWVGMIERTWDSETSSFSMTIGLGNLSWAESPPAGGPEYPVPPNPPNSTIPYIPGPWDIGNILIDTLPKAIQGYTTDLKFWGGNHPLHGGDWNTVAWDNGADTPANGTIKFYDGSTQEISMGDTGEITDDLVYWIYFDLEDVVDPLIPAPIGLHWTNDYMANFSVYTGLLCLIKRGTGGIGSPPTIIPSYGKEPLISTDVIFLAGQYDPVGDPLSMSVFMSTEITAGHIRIWGSTFFDGAWYHDSAITMEAGVGIWGEYMGEETFKIDNITGTIWAGLGAVWLNASGINVCDGTLSDPALRFGQGDYSSFDIKGYMAFTDDDVYGGDLPALSIFTLSGVAISFSAGGIPGFPGYQLYLYEDPIRPERGIYCCRELEPGVYQDDLGYWQTPSLGNWISPWEVCNVGKGINLHQPSGGDLITETSDHTWIAFTDANSGELEISCLNFSYVSHQRSILIETNHGALGYTYYVAIRLGDSYITTYGDLRPSAPNEDIGNSANYYGDVYADAYYYKTTAPTSFQHHKDMDMLKGIKTKDGKLDKTTFPAELLESPEKAQSIVAKLEGECSLLRDNRTKGGKSKEEIDWEILEKLVHADEGIKNVGIDMGAWQSLLMGALLEIDKRLEKLEGAQ